MLIKMDDAETELRPFEIAIFLVLRDAPRKLTTKEIAERTRMSWETAEKYCRTLHQQGYIDLQEFRNRHYWSMKKATDKQSVE